MGLTLIFFLGRGVRASGLKVLEKDYIKRPIC